MAKVIQPKVEKKGDGTADDVIRANIDYVPGAESVQIQIKYWDEVKGLHVKSVEVDADQIAKVLNVFMSNLCVNHVPSHRYMETAKSFKTKKQGRAGSNDYNGATGISEDRSRKYKVLQEEGYFHGEDMETIAKYTAKVTEINEEEVNEINEAMEEE